MCVHLCLNHGLTALPMVLIFGMHTHIRRNCVIGYMIFTFEVNFIYKMQKTYFHCVPRSQALKNIVNNKGDRNISLFQISSLEPPHLSPPSPRWWTALPHHLQGAGGRRRSCAVSMRDIHLELCLDMDVVDRSISHYHGSEGRGQHPSTHHQYRWVMMPVDNLSSTEVYTVDGRGCLGRIFE